ncbi:7TM diverse intracellular signaling domain-containing protein [Polaribacter gochangensis]|uniref:7TM diverse intracellular signaling domain-containing protein n=1 Tax=Polaribacter gochangensis TaxID=3252903 RepID=UPI0039046419
MHSFISYTLNLIVFSFDYLSLKIISPQDIDVLDKVRVVTDSRSFLLGIFFGFMLVMAIYNLLLYFSLKDKAYLLYVGTVIFNILTTLATNNISGQFFWPNRPELDEIIYVTFAGLSMFCSSRFTSEFLQLKEHHKLLDKLMWGIAYLSLLLTVLSLFLTIEQITPFGRWLVLLSFPSYIFVGIVAFRKGFRPAMFYLIAWIPYVLGLIIRVLHGAGWLPGNAFVMSSLELGGALEIVLLSFALADRIKNLQKENFKIRTQLKTYISQVLNLEQKIKSTNNNDADSPENKIEKLAEKHQLTERETDILLQISLGLNNQQIADKLFISINTVKYHTRNVYEKLDVKKRTEISSKILFDK